MFCAVAVLKIDSVEDLTGHHDSNGAMMFENPSYSKEGDRVNLGGDIGPPNEQSNDEALTFHNPTYSKVDMVHVGSSA